MKNIKISLNKFKRPDLKGSLLNVFDKKTDEVRFSLTKLLHHMYIDTHESLPPNNNPLDVYYSKLLTNDNLIEFVKGGLGSHKEIKRSKSNEFGKAFCRLFLSSHFNINHFAHMDMVMKNSFKQKKFSNVIVSRKGKGDTPDYLCADSKNVFLAEAKGRQSGRINFNDANFTKWRNQFKTVSVQQSGKNIKLKGYIVATRLRVEDQAPRDLSKIYIEDPETEGEKPNEDEISEIKHIVHTNHYYNVLRKIGLPLHASALSSGISLPEGVENRVAIWKCEVPSLRNYEFVTRYQSGLDFRRMHPKYWDCYECFRYLWDVNNLNSPFLFLEKTNFDNLNRYVRSPNSMLLGRTNFSFKNANENFLEEEVDFEDVVSTLNDGTLIADLGVMSFDRYETV